MQLPRFSPRVRLQAIAIGIATIAASLVSQFSAFSLEAERRPQDMLTAATAQPADPDLVLLTLDETSLAVGNAGLEPEEIAQSPALRHMADGFPWSREVYAIAVERLLQAGARLIVFDLVFPSPRQGDDALAAVLARAHGRVILANNFDKVESIQGRAAWKIVFPVPALAIVPAGFVNLESSNDSVIRHFAPYATISSMSGEGFDDEKPTPALTTAAALALDLSVPVPSQPEFRRFPYVLPDTIRKPPLYEIFVPALWQQNYRNGEYFRDKIIFIGPTAARLQDDHKTPFGVELPGPEIHLSIFSALRHDTWQYTAPKWAYPVALILSALSVFLLAVGRRNPSQFVWGCLLLGAFWILLFLGAFLLASWFIPIVHPLGALVLCGIAALACDVSFERHERGRIESMALRYVSKDLVRETMSDRESFLHRLGGERREIVSLFSDLKGFTTAAERMEASQMVTLLNEYFTEMVEVILANRGTIDKYLGDALMATWGGFGQATPQENVRLAVKAALEMKKRLAELNLRRRAENQPEWESGIGLTFGAAVFGNIGSSEKMELTVIGDTVNLASRLEGLTRIYGCDFLMDEAAASQVEVPLLKVDVVRVKGRKAAAALFHPVPAVERHWIELFEQARALYVKQSFAEAHDCFTALAKGPLFGLAQCYRARCEAFLASPPAPDWDGTWNFAEK